MAWTTPKTWVNQDPLNESNFNTYIRDNQAALKAQADDSTAKLGNVHPAYLSPLLVGYAVIGIDASVQVTSTTAVVWHAKCKLTFTPKTDLALVGCQFSFVFNHNDDGTRQFNFGLRKGNTAVSLSHTDSISGTLGNESDIVFSSFEKRYESYFTAYQVPVSVTRGVEVTISPTVQVESGVQVFLDNPSVMILTALDVGAYE